MIISLLFRVLSRLPLAWLHALGAAAGWMTWLLSPSYRRRLEANLAHAIGRHDRRLRNAAIVEAGRQALELPFLWLRPSEAVVAKVVEVQGWDIVDAAHAEGAGILFMTPHLGCFEITAQYYASHAPITVLYRPPRKAELGPLMEAGRARGQMRIAPADVSGVRRLVKTLRSREAVGMLPDQTPGKGEGMWAPFFGRPAWTMTLAARLTEVQGVHVIFIWAERLPRGRGYAVKVSRPSQPITGTLEERCAAINREIERLIMERPEQYMWGYNRYKRPSGVPAPEGGA